MAAMLRMFEPHVTVAADGSLAVLLLPAPAHDNSTQDYN